MCDLIIQLKDNFTRIKPIRVETNKNNVNRRFTGSKLKPLMAMDDDETNER